MVSTIIGEYIDQKWIEKIRTDIIMAARYANIARKITGVRTLGDSLGIQTWSYDKMSEVSDAELTWALTDVGEDVIGVTRASKNIPVLHKEFKITGRDLEAARLGNFQISTHTANSAAYKVAVLENQIVMGGYSADGTNYEIDGLYRMAGNSYDTSKDFGTAGNAILAVKGAVEALQDDLIYPPYNMVLNPTQATELKVSILASGAGVRELTIVEELLGGGSIFVTPYQTAGTGMILSPPSTGHHEILVAKDLTVETLLDPWSHDLKGRIYEAIVPIVYEPNSICTLTSI